MVRLLCLLALGLLAADLFEDVFRVGGHRTVGIELEVLLVGLFAAGRRDDLAGFGIDRGFGDEGLALQVVGHGLVGIGGDGLVGRGRDGVGIGAGFGEHDGLVRIEHAGIGGLRLGGGIVGSGGVGNLVLAGVGFAEGVVGGAFNLRAGLLGGGVGLDRLLGGGDRVVVLLQAVLRDGLLDPENSSVGLGGGVLLHQGRGFIELLVLDVLTGGREVGVQVFDLRVFLQDARVLGLGVGDGLLFFRRQLLDVLGAREIEVLGDVCSGVDLDTFEAVYRFEVGMVRSLDEHGDDVGAGFDVVALVVAVLVRIEGVQGSLAVGGDLNLGIGQGRAGGIRRVTVEGPGLLLGVEGERRD